FAKSQPLHLQRLSSDVSELSSHFVEDTQLTVLTDAVGQIAPPTHSVTGKSDSGPYKSDPIIGQSDPKIGQSDAVIRPVGGSSRNIHNTSRANDSVNLDISYSDIASSEMTQKSRGFSSVVGSQKNQGFSAVVGLRPRRTSINSSSPIYEQQSIPLSAVAGDSGYVSRTGEQSANSTPRKHPLAHQVGIWQCDIRQSGIWEGVHTGEGSSQATLRPGGDRDAEMHSTVTVLDLDADTHGGSEPHTHAHTDTPTHTPIHTPTRIDTHIDTPTHTPIHTPTRIDTHIDTPTHTPTHMDVCLNTETQIPENRESEKAKAKAGLGDTVLTKGCYEVSSRDATTADHRKATNSGGLCRYSESQGAGAKSRSGSGSNLTDSPPVFALRRIDLTVCAGELVAVVGGVGSGKTMLMLSILNELHRIQGT
ncbi:hypothetical protein SARC_14781, partial [Sphaeroforma arctica JP610]